MNKRSIVFDNNVLISAALLPTSLPAKAYRFGRDNFIIKYSSVTLVELEDVLFRKKFDKYISFSEKNDFINFFLQFAVWYQFIML